MKVLMIDGALPARDASAGERATFDLIDALGALGHEVSLTALGLNGDEQRREVALREADIPVLDGFGGGLDHLGEALAADDWTVVIVHRPGPALAALGQLANTRIGTIFWGHDIHTWRLQAQQRWLTNVPGHQLAVTQVAERRCWRGYDLSVYPTNREADFVNENGLGHALAMPYYRLTHADLSGSSELPGRRGCLMVGGAFHGPNADAVEFAARQILPLLTGEDAVLTVVGDWPDPPRIPGVRFTGRVSDRKLRELHDEHLCLLAPLRFGAGARRKLVAAMGLGLPVVTTSEGMRGLLVRDAQASDGPLLADDPVEFAAAIAGLREDPDRWRATRDRSLRAVSDVYSAEQFDNAVVQALGKVAP